MDSVENNLSAFELVLNEDWSNSVAVKDPSRYIIPIPGESIRVEVDDDGPRIVEELRSSKKRVPLSFGRKQRK